MRRTALKSGACGNLKRIAVGNKRASSLAARIKDRAVDYAYARGLRFSKRVQLNPSFPPLQGRSGHATHWLHGPGDHKLDLYRRLFPAYDYHLPRVCALLEHHAPEDAVIDIGANIGDTVALARLAGAWQHFLCVEPSARYFAYLEKNARAFPQVYENTTPIRAFVGDRTRQYVLSEGRGTASSDVQASGKPAGALTLSLAEIAGGRPIGLVKSDTDGHDAVVVEQNLEWLKTHQPMLWLEAQLSEAGESARWRGVLEALSESYPVGWAFDNYGTVLRRFDLSPRDIGWLAELLAYTVRCRANQPTIHYFDLLLVSRRFEGLRAELERLFS